MRLPSNLIDGLRGKNLLRLPHSAPKLVLARDLISSDVESLRIYELVRIEGGVAIVVYRDKESGQDYLYSFPESEVVNLAELYDAADTLLEQHLAEHESVLPTPPVKQ